MPRNKLNLSEIFLTLTSPLKERHDVIPDEKDPIADRIQVVPSQTNRILEKTGPSIPNPIRFLSLAVLFFLLASIVLVSRVGILSNTNKNLSEENQKLASSLLSLRNENEALLQDAEKDKIRLRDAINNYKKENESLQFSLKKTEDKFTTLSEEKSYLEEILVNKSKEIEKIKKKSPASVPAVAPVVAVSGRLEELTQKLSQKEQEIEQLSEQNTVLTKRLEKIYSMTNNKMTEINIAKIALEDTIFQAKQTIDEEWNTVDLGSISLPQQQQIPAVKTETPGAPVPLEPTQKVSAKKEASVLAVNKDHHFVIVSVGKADGITRDTRFSIKKNNKVVATLIPLEIRDVMTACNIKDLDQGTTIEINDPVLIQK